MPCLEQQELTFLNQTAQTSYLNFPKTVSGRQPHLVQPELCGGFVPLDMNVRAFVPVEGVEVEPVGAFSADGGQAILSAVRDGRTLGSGRWAMVTQNTQGGAKCDMRPRHVA